MTNLTQPYFAGIAPEWAVVIMRDDPGFWGAWLCLTNHDAHVLLMELEVRALHRDVEVQLYVTPLFIEGPGMATPAWSIAVKTTSGQWRTVE